MSKKKIMVAFLGTWPTGAVHYRIIAFFEYLRDNNIEPTLYSLFNKRLNDIRLKKNIRYKIEIYFLIIKAIIKRLVFILYFSKKFDVIMANREVLPICTPFFEKLLIFKNKKFIIDFDDAIFVKPTFQKDWRDYVNKREKFSQIITDSAHVIAGNNYLAEYARQNSNKVSIIPTCIDVRKFTVKDYNSISDVLTIGWIGRNTTLPSFRTIENILQKLRNKYKFRIMLVGDESIFNIRIEGIDVIYKRFNHKTEVKDLQEMDIGVMPLIDSPWERGKCGFKLLQYMGVGIPAVASPIGVNKDIIIDGSNGFLAYNEDEWYNKLEVLILSEDLRKKIGKLGRKTIEEKYSVQNHVIPLVSIIESIYLNNCQYEN